MRVVTGRRRAADLLFTAALLAYGLGAVLLLAQGAIAAIASVSPGFHETLHVHGLGIGLVARAARRAADASHQIPSLLQVWLDLGFSIIHLILAGVLLWLRPKDWTARLLAVALIGAAGVFNLTSQAVFEQLPPLPLEALAQTGAHVVAGLAYVYALLLFPDGQPVPAWRPRRIVALYLPITIAAVALSVQVEGVSRPASLILFFGLLVPAVGVAAQGYRIRHRGAVTEQAQARLLFWALLPAVGLGLAFVATQGLSPTTIVLAGRHIPDPPVTLYRVFQPVFLLIPLALFAGILRYRLWDIERLVNRTVVYALATTFLGAVYTAFVLAVQLMAGSVTASPLVDSKPAVALSTLLLAAVFRPVRDRVQTFVDKRFNRRRYNAQVTVERFTSSLRTEVELASIAHRLEQTLDEAIEPQHVSLLLFPGHGIAATHLGRVAPGAVARRSRADRVPEP